MKPAQAQCYRIPFGRTRIAVSKPFMLLAYRIVYGLVAALLLVNFFNTHYYGDVPRSLPWLILGCRVLLVFVMAAAAAFWRLSPAVIWAVVFIWEALFVWYAWFSPGAPFAMYSASEWTIVLFGALFVWFLSLAALRSVLTKSSGRNH